MKRRPKLGRRRSMFWTHSWMVPSVLLALPSITKDFPSLNLVLMESTFSHSAPKPDASKGRLAMPTKTTTCWFWTKIWAAIKNLKGSTCFAPTGGGKWLSIWHSTAQRDENGRAASWAAKLMRKWGKWLQNQDIDSISRLCIDMSSKTRLSTLFHVFSRILVYKVYIYLRICIYIYIYMYTYVCFIYEYVWWFVEIVMCVCVWRCYWGDKWSKPNVSEEFCQVGYVCSFWETIQAIECHLTSQVNLLGATLKKSHKKKDTKRHHWNSAFRTDWFLTGSLQWLLTIPSYLVHPVQQRTIFLITALLSFGWSMGKRDSPAMKQA